MPTEPPPPAPAPASAARQPMPPWIPRLVLLGVGAFFGVLALQHVLRALRGLLVMLVVSIFLSFALEPVVNWLTKHRWRRGAATAAVLFALFVFGVLVVAAMVPLLVDQIRGLVTEAPTWLDRISVYTERWFGLEISTERVVSQLGEVRGNLGSFAGNVAGNLLGVGAAVIGAVFQLLTIALFTFYLVADGPKVRRTVLSVFRPERQREVLWAWEVAIDKTGGYLYSRALLALVAGVLSFAVMSILGVPYAAALALWVAVLSQFVPVVGTYVAMVVPLFVAVLSSPLAAIVLLVFFIVYQQLENYLFAPRITAHTMQLHPAVAFGAVIAGASLIGPVGAFLALPAAAIVQAGLGAYVTRHDVAEIELTGEVIGTPAAKRRSWRRRRKRPDQG